MTLAEALGSDAKIAVGGKIHVGRVLRLEEHLPVATAAPAFMFTLGLPDEIPAVENPLLQNPGALPLQELDYELRETDDELFIADKGLTLSYGIFGVPGSGKTFLMLRLLRQILALEAQDPARKVGALILDPKAVLINDVKTMLERVGRADDLVVLNAEHLQRAGESVNVLDADLDPYELGRALVLAAQSAGVAASEPYWFGAWRNLFSAAISLMAWLGTDVLTLDDLVNAVMTVEPARADTDALISNAAADTAPRRRIQWIAEEARARIGERPEELRAETLAAINAIEVFYAQDTDAISTVGNIITAAYGEFLRARTRCFSKRIAKGDAHKPFYDTIIDEGKIVLVSVSTSDPGLAKVLCTLIKNLFMQSVRSRLDRVRSGRLQNFERPLVLACDEYDKIASEIPGEVGDGEFFSIARQQGCMGIVATQSVNSLQSSSLKENWKAIFSNFGAKVFMRAADNETVEEATKLAGETDWYQSSQGTSSGAQGLGSSQQRDLKERKELPGHVLTQLIGMGQGVVIGSLDGGVTRPSTWFIHVPND